MRLLLDTHALIWWLENNPRLSAAAREAIADASSDVLVSVVSVFEIATKYRIGQLPDVAALVANFQRSLDDQGFETLPLLLAHADLGGSLAIQHNDPFDRLLIAQAQIERAMLVSVERLFDQFGVRRLW